MRLCKKFEVVVFSLVVVFSFVLFLISMSSLMADTHVVNASCNDARFGACTSDQTSFTTDEIMSEDFQNESVDLCDLGSSSSLGWSSPPANRSFLEELLVAFAAGALEGAVGAFLASPFGLPVLAGVVYCQMR
jgi:hypothetical protein